MFRFPSSLSRLGTPDPVGSKFNVVFRRAKKVNFSLDRGIIYIYLRELTARILYCTLAHSRHSHHANRTICITHREQTQIRVLPFNLSVIWPSEKLYETVVERRISQQGPFSSSSGAFGHIT